MNYKDRVYGEIEIIEPVILELINSPSLQRLKGIDQAGYRPLWVKPETEVGESGYTRFNHSMGVYLLLLRYGAPPEEQIAGLIHDVSHSAFSHCIDYVLDAGSEEKQSRQDDLFHRYVMKTEIPAIIKKHGFNIEYILDDNNFPLKETALPDLCADRIDSSLKDALIFGEIDDKEKNYFLDSLATQDNKWVFKDLASAKKYAKLFLKLNTVYYTSLLSAKMFRLVGDCLKYALSKGYISEGDLYTTDKIVIEKIKTSLYKDKALSLLFDRMNNKVEAVNDPDNYDVIVSLKSRIVDPLFKAPGGFKRLSEAYLDWRRVLAEELKPKQYFLKFKK